jgi:hypothetical protein
MKRLIYIAISVIGALLLSSSSCEEIINPQDEGMLIDKSVSPSTTETVLSHGNDIQIIIPGGALTEDATFKVEKNSNPPAMNIDKMLLGNNVYKIKISGQTDFNAPIQIVINYSQNMLDDNDLTEKDVRGLIYANGTWAIASYTIDPTYKKIIISIDSPLGKAKQNSDIPLTDGEIVIVDGYTTIDQGDKDLLILKSKDFSLFTFFSIAYETKSYDIEGKLESTVYDTTYVRNDFFTAFSYKILWSGLTFSIDEEFESKDIDFTGTISKDGNTLETFIYSLRDEKYDLKKEVLELQFTNIPLDNILKITDNIFYIDYQVKTDFNQYISDFYHRIEERTPNEDGVWITRKEITGSLLGAYVDDPDKNDYLLFRFE